MAYGAAAVVTLFVVVYMLLVFAWLFLSLHIANKDFKGAEAVGIAIFFSPYLVGVYFGLAYTLEG